MPCVRASPAEIEGVLVVMIVIPPVAAFFGGWIPVAVLAVLVGLWYLTHRAPTA